MVRCVLKTSLFQRSFLATREAAWYITLVVSVCQTITFESLDVKSSDIHIRYIFREYPLPYENCRLIGITSLSKTG